MWDDKADPRDGAREGDGGSGHQRRDPNDEVAIERVVHALGLGFFSAQRNQIDLLANEEKADGAGPDDGQKNPDGLHGFR